MTINELCKNERIKRGDSQIKAAEGTGFTRSYVSMFENGTRQCYELFINYLKKYKFFDKIKDCEEFK